MTPCITSEGGNDQPVSCTTTEGDNYGLPAPSTTSEGANYISSTHTTLYIAYSPSTLQK